MKKLLMMMVMAAGMVAGGEVTNGMLCLTFDDRNFDAWLAQRELFKKYNAHVTFFVCGTIDDAAAAKLRLLAADGHAVGLHSAPHTKAPEAIAGKSEEAFLADYVDGQLADAKLRGLNPRTFAYPMSTRNAATDAALVKRFCRMRSGRFDRDGREFRDVPGFMVPPEEFRARTVHDAFGIGSDAAFDLDLHLRMVDDLAAKNLCATFYSHSICGSKDSHDMSPAALEAILARAKARGVRVVSMEDLGVAQSCATTERDELDPVRLKVLRHGYDGKTCLVQVRTAVAPWGTVVTGEDLDVTKCDFMFGIKKWDGKEFVLESNLDRWEAENGGTGALLDPVPWYHKASGKIVMFGCALVYESDSSVRKGSKRVFYSVYNRASGHFGKVRLLPNAHGWATCSAGCTQPFELPDGDVLLPVCGEQPAGAPARVAVMRCGFDGETLTVKETGDELTFNFGRGLYEPSVIGHGGKFWLTMRNDERGYVATGADGLHYGEVTPWRWESGEEVPTYNTQSHWLTLKDRLYLVYTRRAVCNGRVFRHRAPLWVAEVREAGDGPRVVRATERAITPERGARCGNFGTAQLPDGRAMVTVSEWMQPVGCEKYGSDNAVFQVTLGEKK